MAEGAAPNRMNVEEKWLVSTQLLTDKSGPGLGAEANKQQSNLGTGQLAHAALCLQACGWLQCPLSKTPHLEPHSPSPSMKGAKVKPILDPS